LRERDEGGCDLGYVHEGVKKVVQEDHDRA
jgi:hypothetical protein